MWISKVLPTHNRVDLLREAMASVQNQTWPEWELVIVDDDLPTENALEVIVQQFKQYHDLECLFINIDPFGATGNGMRQNQAQTLNAPLVRMALSD